MKVLLAGASGFLGKTLLSYFSNSGHSVWALRHHSSLNNLLLAGVIDIQDLENTKESFDWILIATGNYQLSPTDLAEANGNLIQELSLQFPNSRIIFISSTEVYDGTIVPITEKTQPNPLTEYGQAKISAEKKLQKHRSFAVIRLTVLYDEIVPNTSFLPSIIQSARERRSITLTDHGKRLQDYLHVNDAVSLCLKAAEYTKNDVFLGATGRSISNKQVAEKICSLIKNCTIEYKGTSQAISLEYNPSYTHKTLQWQPRIELLDFLPQMI